jgi:CRISPR-associated protein Cst1
MLKYTGHPFVDVGLAAILANSGKKNLESLVEDDFENIATYMEENYNKEPLRSYLTSVFMNSAYTNFAYWNAPDKRKIYSDRVLRSFRASTPTLLDERDIFLDLPVPAIPFDVGGNLPFGRAFRQHIPLLMGENIINFYPNGEAGQSISGLALLAIQAFPLGSARTDQRNDQGKTDHGLLAILSDNDQIIQFFARESLKKNKLDIHLAGGKLPPSSRTLATLVIERLLEALQMQADYKQDESPFSITAYYMNSGRNPFVHIYHLPSNLILFVKTMHNADYTREWSSIVQRAWEVAPEKREKKQEEKVFTPRKNYLYEDLFRLPENANRFIRTYFLRAGLKLAKMEEGDPRQKYSLRLEMEIVSWKITQEFLRRIMHMESDRINQIRDMSDRLAEYINSENDKRFFQEFFAQNRYDFFRSRLLKTNLAHVKRGNAPIIEFEPYITVFEEGIEQARSDWRLSRDLVLIRMIERLYKLGWFGKNPDVITEELTKTESEPQL